MSSLAWGLLLLGALLVVGVYGWGQFRLRRRERRIVEHIFDQEPIEAPSIPTGRATRDSENASLADLRSLVVDSTSPPAARPRGETRRRRPAGERYGQTALALDDTLPPPEVLPTCIVSLHILAREGQTFAGTALERVLREVQMHFGEMSIYHHLGVGQSQSSTPVFSLANMFEPGTFDAAAMDEFETRGLSLFMQLPGPLDGSVALELMLASSQRLAEQLDGLLLGPDRNPLAVATIADLRAQVARYRADVRR